MRSFNAESSRSATRRRLVEAGVTIQGLRLGDPERIVVEAYPGALARQLISRTSQIIRSTRRMDSGSVASRTPQSGSGSTGDWSRHGFVDDNAHFEEGRRQANFITHGCKMSDAVGGLVTVECNAAVRDTANRLAELIEANGLRVFARIDHAGNAAEAGMELRPTELLIFGNPRGGTPLMQDRRTAGLDLPFKVLVWEDEDSKIWLTYNDPVWLVERHGLSSLSDPVIKAIKEGMAKMSAAVGVL